MFAFFLFGRWFEMIGQSERNHWKLQQFLCHEIYEVRTMKPPEWLLPDAMLWQFDSCFVVLHEQIFTQTTIFTFFCGASGFVMGQCNLALIEISWFSRLKLNILELSICNEKKEQLFENCKRAYEKEIICSTCEIQQRSNRVQNCAKRCNGDNVSAFDLL